MLEKLHKFLHFLLEILHRLTKVEEEIVTVEGKGYTIYLPKDKYDELKSQGYSFSVSSRNKKPNSVAIRFYKDGKYGYLSTLKSYLNVVAFKDGNVCNFATDNCIFGVSKEHCNDSSEDCHN